MTHDVSTFFIELYQTQHGPRHSTDFTFAEINLKTLEMFVLRLQPTITGRWLAESC